MQYFISLLLTIFTFSVTSIAQQSSTTYPIPDYTKEIYLVKRDSTLSLVRLEKGTSKQEMKLKMMGMAGMDNGYELEGEKSPVRLSNGSSLIFAYYSGEANAGGSSAKSDSIMKANGMDLAMMNNAMESMMDPTQNISLYSMRPDNGKRKALLQSMGIMGKSKKTAVKYTLSTKKLKGGFYELVVDKTLPKGEYTFTMMSMGSMDQSYTLFAFGID